MIRDLLEAMYAFIDRQDEMARINLADALEEEGLLEEATHLRNQTLKLHDSLAFMVTLPKDETVSWRGDTSGKYVVYIHQKDLVNRMVRQARRNRNRQSSALDGIVSCHKTLGPIKVKKEKQTKNQIPLSELQNVQPARRERHPDDQPSV